MLAGIFNAVLGLDDCLYARLKNTNHHNIQTS